MSLRLSVEERFAAHVRLWIMTDGGVMDSKSYGDGLWRKGALCVSPFVWRLGRLVETVVVGCRCHYRLSRLELIVRDMVEKCLD